MERRTFERIPAFLSGKVLHEDSFHDALILNVSQNGIYFIAKIYLLSGFNIVISIPSDGTEIKVLCRIVRISETGITSFRFGAEIISPSQEYIEFIHDRIE